MTDAMRMILEALRLLDEIDATPLSEINKKLDSVTCAVVAARHALKVQERAENVA